MPNWEGSKQIRLNEAVLNLGSGITLSKGKDPITNQESYDLDSAGGGDFFRDLSFNLPDGVTDTTDSIRRDGEIGLLVDPESTLDVNGSVAYSTRSSVAGAVIQGSTDRTVVLNLVGAQTFQLLSPSVCPRREITIVNPTIVSKSFLLQNYTDLYGNIQTTIPAHCTLTLQSDGLIWRLVNTTRDGYPPILVTVASVALGVDNFNLICNNAAAPITVTLPNASTCIGRKYNISRGPLSTGAITIAVPGGNVVQNLNGTTGVSTTIAAHSAGGAGLNISFTAVNIAGTLTWARI